MFSLVFYFPSFILLFAGLMKLVAVWSHDIFVAPWLALATNIGIALLELGMGSLLVARPHHRAVLFVGISLFCCFAVFSGWKLISGIDDCGCFGRFSTHPSISLSVSCVAILVLVERAYRWTNKSSIGVGSRSMLRVAMVVFLLMLMSFLIGQASHWIEGKRTFSDDIQPGDLVVVSAERWIDQPFPLKDFILGPNNYLVGEWEILFYSKDCRKCREVLNQIDFTQINNLAIIEIPPFGLDQPLDNDAGNRADNQAIWLRLSPGYRWLIEPATKLKLVDGVVKSVKHTGI